MHCITLYGQQLEMETLSNSSSTCLYMGLTLELYVQPPLPGRTDVMIKGIKQRKGLIYLGVMSV